MKTRVLFLAVSAGLWMTTVAAFANTTLGEFKDWTAYVFKEAEGKMCAVITTPIKSKYSQPIKGRNTVQFFVAQFPEKDIHSQPSIMIGYPLAAGAKVAVEIDGDSKFTMFTQEEFAWLPDEEDRALVDAMRKGKEMVVEGKSQRGTVTTDTYSLIGLGAALDAIKKECP